MHGAMRLAGLGSVNLNLASDVINLHLSDSENCRVSVFPVFEKLVVNFLYINGVYDGAS